MDGEKKLVAKDHIQLKLPADGAPSTASIEQVLSDFQTMAIDSFPNNPTRRRAVLILKQHDLEKCAYEPGAARRLLDEEAYVLQCPVSQQGEMPKALRNIINAGLVRADTILVQSPFDPDVYEEASLAPQRFALAKHMYFSTFCMHLGAKEVSVEQIDLQTETGKTTIDVKGDRPGTGAEASVKTEIEELERFRSQMNLLDEFTGGPVDINAAEQLLHRTGLLNDPNMRTLLEMRREGTNQLRTRKMALNLSSETRSNLNVVGRLNLPTFLNLKTKYARIGEQQREYTLTIKVRF